MLVLMKGAVIAAGIMTTGLYLAVPANADPGFEPCHGIATFLCRTLPLSPDLDHRC